MCLPEALRTQDGDTSNENNSSFAFFYKYAMFSFAITSGLASDSDNLKIIITLHYITLFHNAAYT